jgi:ATP-dependent Clp protease, protease subunit
MKVLYQVFRGENGNAAMYIYGILGTGENELSANKFEDELSILAATHPIIKINMNCDGGSVREGMQIYNAILKSRANVEMYCSGIVASMGSIVFQAGKKQGSKRIMASGSRMMIHQASIELGGQSDDLRDAADALDGINEDMRNIYMKASGQTEKVVKAWMSRGKNTWLTASQCLALGLCDEIDDAMPIVMNFEDNSLKMVAQMNEHLINNQSVNHNNQSHTMDKKLLAMALGLPDSATEAEIQAKIISLKNADADAKAKITALEAENQKHLADKIAAMLDGAVASGKITEAQKATFEPLAKADYANCKLAIDGMVGATAVAPANAGITSISDAIAKHQGAAPAATKTWKEYAQTNPEYLENLEKTNPTAWKALYKSQYGVEPK